MLLRQRTNKASVIQTIFVNIIQVFVATATYAQRCLRRSDHNLHQAEFELPIHKGFSVSLLSHCQPPFRHVRRCKQDITTVTQASPFICLSLVFVLQGGGWDGGGGGVIEDPHRGFIQTVSFSVQ